MSSLYCRAVLSRAADSKVENSYRIQSLESNVSRHIKSSNVSYNDGIVDVTMESENLVLFFKKESTFFKLLNKFSEWIESKNVEISPDRKICILCDPDMTGWYFDIRHLPKKSCTRHVERDSKGYFVKSFYSKDEAESLGVSMSHQWTLRFEPSPKFKWTFRPVFDKKDHINDSNYYVAWFVFNFDLKNIIWFENGKSPSSKTVENEWYSSLFFNGGLYPKPNYATDYGLASTSF